VYSPAADTRTGPMIDEVENSGLLIDTVNS
jgi:hypothetical protein